MDAEAKRLSDMASQMDPGKRRDLQEVLANELQRRREIAMNQANVGSRNRTKASRISGGLDRDAMGEIYASIDQPVQELKVKQLEEKLAHARGMEQKASRQTKSTSDTGGEPWFANPFAALIGSAGASLSGSRVLLFGLIACGILKIVFTATDSESAVPSLAEMSAQPVQEVALVSNNTSLDAVTWSESDKALLTKLDDRRVDLERRSAQIDQRERQVEEQVRMVSERMAELKSVSNKLAEVRREKDSHQQKRLEQLAGVYTSMAPTEAAELLSRIDDEIALGLLERMPGKRLGQILGLMKPDRAVSLTKSLTDRDKI